MTAEPLVDTTEQFGTDCRAHLFGCPAEPCPAHAAQEYAARGWRVIPISPGKKKPPMNEWQNHATTEMATVLEWWGDRFQSHGVGVAMGHDSGVFVLDVDVSGDKVGDETLKDLTDSYGPLPETATVVTGSGGAHYYFTYPTTLTIRNDTAAKLLGPGLDVKTTGQCVAPPTVHPNGQRYEWEGGEIGQVAEAPGWLLALLTAEPEQVTQPTTPKVRLGELFNDDGPADRFNTEHTWEELLGADGWVLEQTDRNGEQHWRRPGKSKGEGTGATVGGAKNPAGDCLFVFTSSVPYLAPDTGYSRFGYYAARHHNGDAKAAARALMSKRVPSRGSEKAEKQRPDEPWPEPVPFVTDHPAPAFPVEVLPEPFRTFAIERSREAGTNPDLLAAFVLPILATLMGGRWRVEIRPGWQEPTNLYLVGVAPPGTMKSFAVNSAAAPLHELEAEMANRYGPEIARAIQEREIEEGKRDDYKKAAVKGDDNAARAALDLTDWLEANQVPTIPELFGGNDATPESIEMAMAQQGGAFSWLDDEGGLFTMTAGRYSAKGQATNLSVFLKGHDGQTPIKVKRGSRPEVHVERPALTIGVLAQPSAFGDFVASDTGRGLIQRFLVMRPDLDAVDRSVDHPPADPRALNDYAQRIRDIHRQREKLSADGWVRVLTLEPEALEVLRALLAANADDRRPGGRFHGDEVRAGWGNKLDGTTARLAALLAVGANPEALTVNAEAARAAVALAEYFTPHTLKAFDEAGMSETMRNATTVLNALRRIGAAEVTTRDVHTKVRGTVALEKAAEVGEVLRYLADFGWVSGPHELVSESGKGRKGEGWMVHPSLLT